MKTKRKQTHKTHQNNLQAVLVQSMTRIDRPLPPSTPHDLPRPPSTALDRPRPPSTARKRPRSACWHSASSEKPLLFSTRLYFSLFFSTILHFILPYSIVVYSLYHSRGQPAHPGSKAGRGARSLDCRWLDNQSQSMFRTVRSETPPANPFCEISM